MKSVLLVTFSLLCWQCGAQSGDPSDLSYLLAYSDDDINELSYDHMAERADYVETNFQRWHQSNGMVYKAYYAKKEDQTPTAHDNGGDTAIFTGHYLAGAVYRYKITTHPDDLNKIIQTLRGLHILTHISGVPGVVARAAWPVKKQTPEFPDITQKEYSYKSTKYVQDILRPWTVYPQMWFRTKATRDQLTGILYGLSVAWVELPFNQEKKILQARKIIRTIALALYHRLEDTDYVLKDHLGYTGTNAASLNEYLKALAIGLPRRILRDENKPEDKKLYERLRDQYDGAISSAFASGGFLDFFHPINNAFQYFAWNLRFARTYALFITDTNGWRRGKLFLRVRDNMWMAKIVGFGPAVKHHRNAHFAFLYFDILETVWKGRNLEFKHLKLKESVKEDNPNRQYHRLHQAIWSLQAFSLRPLRSYDSPLAGQDFDRYEVIKAHLRKPTEHFVWQKEPFNRVGEPTDGSGLAEATGVDYLLPYWMGRVKFSNWHPFKKMRRKP